MRLPIVQGDFLDDRLLPSIITTLIYEFSSSIFRNSGPLFGARWVTVIQGGIRSGIVGPPRSRAHTGLEFSRLLQSSDQENHLGLVLGCSGRKRNLFALLHSRRHCGKAEI